MSRPVHLARWLRVGRWVMAAFLVVVVVLLVRYARAVDWPKVGAALAAYDATSLLVAGGLVALSYLCLCGYDLTARAYTGHRVSTLRTMVIAFISYAFSLNLGALIGGGGFRLRMYSRSGVSLANIGRIIASTVATNWIGYVLLAGVLFVSGVVILPEGWGIGRAGLRALGAVMVVAVVVYLLGCVRWRGRVWKIRGHKLHLPSLPLASLQLLIAVANWLAMGAILFVLLRQQVPFTTVVGVLLLAAIAAAVIHIPAGLGVLEAVFIGLLGTRIGEAELLAALLSYRALYFLLPLVVATVLYAVFEARAKSRS